MIIKRVIGIFISSNLKLFTCGFFSELEENEIKSSSNQSLSSSEKSDNNIGSK